MYMTWANGHSRLAKYGRVGKAAFHFAAALQSAMAIGLHVGNLSSTVSETCLRLIIPTARVSLTRLPLFYFVSLYLKLLAAYRNMATCPGCHSRFRIGVDGSFEKFPVSSPQPPWVVVSKAPKPQLWS